MNTNDKDLQESRKLNEKSRQGNMSNSTNTTGYNNSGAEEARKLNEKSRQNKSE